METGRVTIIVAVITMVGGLATAVIANLDKIKGDKPSTPPISQPDTTLKPNIELKNKTKELELVKAQFDTEKEKNEKLKNSLDEKEKEIERLKKPFHQINNSKLKQLLLFHNDAVCYGRSLNFTHPPDDSYRHCVSKEVLAKRFIKFFEELELIKTNGSVDYSQEKAKNELIKLQDKYGFKDTGWYTELVLGILIIEYAKKS